MSKPASNIVSGTSGANKISQLKETILRNKTRSAVEKLINSTKDGKRKSIAVGAYNIATGKIVTSFAKEIPSKIHPELIKRANEIGGIGSHGLTERNTVGVCAEFQVVNKLLLQGSKWSDIRLTNAIRPRTGQKIPFCANCQKMFSDIIDKGE